VETQGHPTDVPKSQTLLYHKQSVTLSSLSRNNGHCQGEIRGGFGTSWPPDYNLTRWRDKEKDHIVPPTGRGQGLLRKRISWGDSGEKTKLKLGLRTDSEVNLQKNPAKNKKEKKKKNTNQEWKGGFLVEAPAVLHDCVIQPIEEK